MTLSVSHPSTIISVAIAETRTLNTDGKSAVLQASTSAEYNLKTRTSSATKSAPLVMPVTVTNSVFLSRRAESLRISSTQREFLAANKTSAAASVKLNVSPIVSASISVSTRPYMSSVVPTTPSIAGTVNSSLGSDVYFNIFPFTVQCVCCVRDQADKHLQ